jgi:omega-amidase
MRAPALRIAIAQPAMHWSGDANTASVIETLALASVQGAILCVFPELTVTGYHRRIAEAARPERVEPWLQAVQAGCKARCIAAAVGAPSFGHDGRIFNSQILIDACGERLAVVEKRGLTAPEATFFAPGKARPTVALSGMRCSAVLCREVEDLDDVCSDLAAAAPELIFWPGLMGPEAGTEHIDPPTHVQDAQRLARRLGAFVLQANWPESLNYPESSACTGRSVVIRPDGEIAFALPQAQAGLAVFNLGESSYAWHPQAH